MLAPFFFTFGGDITRITPTTITAPWVWPPPTLSQPSRPHTYRHFHFKYYGDAPAPQGTTPRDVMVMSHWFHFGASLRTFSPYNAITNEYLPTSCPAQRLVERPPGADPTWSFAHAQSLDVAKMRGVSTLGLLTPWRRCVAWCFSYMHLAVKKFF